MPSDSIRAYDLGERVAAYDSDMDLMHPNRHQMSEVILEVLASTDPQPSLILDIGSGTGFLLERLLRRFPNCRAIGMDGAQQMVDLAKSRLHSLAGRVEFRIGDFRDFAKLCTGVTDVDAVVSSYALHHLNTNEKLRVCEAARRHLRPGGWFLNADLIVAKDAHVEELMQRMRVRGIVQRAGGRDPRFLDEESTREFVANLQRNESDQPLTDAEDLRLLKQAGYRHPTLFWKEMREAVTGGIR